MTDKREAELRALVALVTAHDWLSSSEAHQLRTAARDLLDALDAERAAHRRDLAAAWRRVPVQLALV